jgi:hypothetical protein
MTLVVTMASLKAPTYEVGQEVQWELCPDWYVGFDTNSRQYSLMHGKKTITFNSGVAKQLCCRQYGIVLANGRRRMEIPSHVLQAFVDHDLTFQWLDSCFLVPMKHESHHFMCAEEKHEPKSHDINPPISDEKRV